MKIDTLFTSKIIILIQRKTYKLLCLVILLTTVIWLTSSLYKKPMDTNVRVEGLREIRISSTEYPYYFYLTDKPNSAYFKENQMYYKTTASITADVPPYDYYSFTFFYEDGQQILLHYSPTANMVYNTKYNMIEPSPNLKEVLLDLTASYRQEICMTYGALLVWEDVDKIFPMYATAKITDIYTGSTFTVQRREGSSHVDAQPLTAEDTAIMKNIYGGRWSWGRTGIIVGVRGYRIAASMHGMPHGGGKIDDNNFPGHFCIHFLGSTIHGGGMDTQHHREILKAAGKLPRDDS